MRVLVVGATGLIGGAVVEALRPRHEVVAVSRSKAALAVDLDDPGSITRMYQAAGRVDAVVSAAGLGTFGPLADLTDADFLAGLGNKLMGQVNLVRRGAGFVNDGGSFTLTSGVLSRRPMQGSAAISMANAGLEGFARAAALELPRGIRINVVSPGWVAETLKAMGMDPSKGTPASEVARAYLSCVEGSATGQVLDTPPL
ncbi:MAG: short chain dehydrogenase [Candidatus Eisenbacteria bacterium]|nr:short chain dehydrogenase [Candidatus Eisenbacteria bacterium]